MKQLRQYLSGNMRQYGMVIALTVITLLFGILTDGNIFNAMNVSNLILQNSYLILLSVGMFFCILTGILLRGAETGKFVSAQMQYC